MLLREAPPRSAATLGCAVLCSAGLSRFLRPDALCREGRHLWLVSERSRLLLVIPLALSLSKGAKRGICFTPESEILSPES